MPRSLLLLSALVLPAAPAPKPPVPYFVTQRGARLVYQVRDEEKVAVVAAVEKKDGATVVTVHEVLRDGRTVPDEVVVVSEKGLFRVGFWGQKLSEPRCFLKLPFKPGDKWDLIDGVKATSVGEEEVTVAAGKWRALRVDCEVSGPNGVSRFSHWYGPGVGLIKVVMDGEERRSLKSFTPGRPDPAKP
jgi:hypothetical protein